MVTDSHPQNPECPDIELSTGLVEMLLASFDMVHGQLGYRLDLDRFGAREFVIRDDFNVTMIDRLGALMHRWQFQRLRVHIVLPFLTL